MDRLNIPGPSKGIKMFWNTLEYILGTGEFATDVNNGGLVKYLEDFLVEIGTDNFIVTGCGLTGSNVAAGWVFLDGELLKVPAHVKTSTHFVKSIVNPAQGARTDASGGSVNIYDQYIAEVTAGSGSLAFSNAATLRSKLGEYLGEEQLWSRVPSTISDANAISAFSGYYRGNTVSNVPTEEAATNVSIIQVIMAGIRHQVLYGETGIYHRVYDSTWGSWGKVFAHSDSDFDVVGIDASYAAGYSDRSTDLVNSNVTLDEKGGVCIDLHCERDNDTRSLIFTLPAKYRPSVTKTVKCIIYGGGNASTTLSITTSGLVSIPAGTTYLNLRAKIAYTI